MARTLHIPAVEHAARAWQLTVPEITKGFVNLYDHPPSFRYAQLYSLVRDLLFLKVPYEQVVEGVKRSVRPPVARDAFLEILPMIQRHFDEVSPDYVIEVPPSFYPIGQNLSVPIRPPVVYGVGGQLYLPWFLFWKSNPLRGEKERLFITIMKEVMQQDPFFDDVKFEILSFAAGKRSSKRKLVIRDAADVKLLSEERKAEMLTELASGFENALRIIEARMSSRPEPGTRNGDRPSPDNPQGDLFR